MIDSIDLANFSAMSKSREEADTGAQEAPNCEHGIPRRWLEKPEPYGWRGWFCAADVPSEELCLPIFVGRAHQYSNRRRLRPHWRGKKEL